MRTADNLNQVADIKRNYPHFWHAWADHANGCEYLLCGEDYQGQTVVNLTEGKSFSFFPEAGFNGKGFCWTAAYPAPDTSLLAVDGCIWGGPYDIVFFDFSKPDDLPYRELFRVDSLDDCDGWLDNDRFKLTREVQVRKSDGRPSEELSPAEQDELDANDELGAYIQIDVIVTRDQILGR